MELYLNKEFLKKYDEAFEEACFAAECSNSFGWFEKIMEERMGEALFTIGGYTKDAFNETLDQILDNAKDHYRDLASKYAVC